ncbi:hypothetical protein MPH_01142 [Macrophomina phaseolina MS6]|uniref:Uncharacterized protein n=1 Tax=Macrophomina phaseolina (strain MS6) TaxID=1126212 RepID=K2S3S6_MACPH|nr:hypothetical protein MPH_01142 [Macrophomina phaseolina MS6]
MPKWGIHERRSCHLNEPREVEDIDFPGDLDEYYHKQLEAEAVDCYIFAYKYEIRLFMNDLFDSILEMNPFSNVVPSYSVVLKVWKELPATSHLRKYLIELFARVWTHKTDVGCLEELILRKLVSSEFWLSILMQRSEHGELDDYPPWEENLCQYHDHDEYDPETCYWQLINGGHGYCTGSSDSCSDSEMEDYEADFIDDDEVESNTVDNADTQPIEGTQESLSPSSNKNSSIGRRSSSGTVAF